MSRELMPCGTPAAARRHYLRGEKPCEACLKAQREYWKAWHSVKSPSQRPPGRPRSATCGTSGGYHAHKRYGEVACWPCVDAVAAQQRDYRARKRAAQEEVTDAA